MTFIETGRVQLHEIKPEFAGQRIDNYCLARLKGVPKSLIYRLLRKGQIRVNKKRVKPDQRLAAGDILRLPPLRTREARAPLQPPASLIKQLDEAIIFEDTHLIVLNKPTGLAVHGGSGVPYGLIETMRVLRPECACLELVHRLDRGTSGCLLLAKNRSTLLDLHESLRDESLIKEYVALLQGRWGAALQVSVNAPLASVRDSSGERKIRVSDEGKAALTDFRLSQQFKKCCRLHIRLHSGRMHQIRVHAQSIGHPILGDKKYGDRQVNQWLKTTGYFRLYLHASRLRFDLKGANKQYDFEAPFDEDWLEFENNIIYDSADSSEREET